MCYKRVHVRLLKLTTEVTASGIIWTTRDLVTAWVGHEDEEEQILTFQDPGLIYTLAFAKIADPETPDEASPAQMP